MEKVMILVKLPGQQAETKYVDQSTQVLLDILGAESFAPIDLGIPHVVGLTDPEAEAKGGAINVVAGDYQTGGHVVQPGQQLELGAEAVFGTVVFVRASQGGYSSLDDSQVEAVLRWLDGGEDVPVVTGPPGLRDAISALVGQQLLPVAETVFVAVVRIRKAPAIDGDVSKGPDKPFEPGGPCAWTIATSPASVKRWLDEFLQDEDSERFRPWGPADPQDTSLLVSRWAEWGEDEGAFGQYAAEVWHLSMEPVAASAFLGGGAPLTQRCKRCSSDLDANGWCTNVMCPHSDWPQSLDMERDFTDDGFLRDRKNKELKRNRSDDER